MRMLPYSCTEIEDWISDNLLHILVSIWTRWLLMSSGLKIFVWGARDLRCDRLGPGHDIAAVTRAKNTL